MNAAKPLKTLVFDWGDTLMIDFPHYSGPMVTWPEVAAVEGILSALAALHKTCTILVATNAVESDLAQVRGALDRAGIGRYVSAIYSPRNLGVSKLELHAFYRRLEQAAGLDRDETAMIGDNFRYDVLGAHQAGWAAIWYNPSHRPAPGLVPLHTADVGRMADLTAAVERLSLPDYETCLAWHQHQGTPRSLLNHVEMVAAVAYRMALWLRARGEAADPVLAHRGGLLHDLAKIKEKENPDGRDHGWLAGELLESLGQPVLAELARRHVLFGILEPDRAPRTWEEKLVFFADKLVEGSRVVTLEERLAALERRYHPFAPGELARLQPPLLALQDELCAAMGFPADELAPRLTAAVSGQEELPR